MIIGLATSLEAKAPESQEVTLQEFLLQKVIEANLTYNDYEILNCIAKNESNWRNVPNYLYDGEDGIYTAYGPYQILKSTAKRYSDKDRLNPYNNVEIAVLIYGNEGYTPWLVWRSCI